MDLEPPLLGLCAGFERGEWRSEPFAEHLIEYLLDFVYSDAEQAQLTSRTARRALKSAAETVYKTEKFGRRGEFGELLLHVVLRQHFNTIPAVRKIYFKDSPNDTVKGFDAVHVVATESDLELWLGEVKFYSDLGAAIRSVSAELVTHSRTNYLRTEFSLIMNKLDDAFPHYDRLRMLLDPTVSLDEVFARLRVPVLLTYDSGIPLKFGRYCDEYSDEIRSELLQGHADFVNTGLPTELVITLILIPLATKRKLIQILDEKLRGMQR